MTKMIYRGFPVTNTDAAPAGKARSMVYRGAAHNGAQPVEKRFFAASMIYRGIGFTKTAAGWIIPDQKPQFSAVFSAVPAE